MFLIQRHRVLLPMVVGHADIALAGLFYHFAIDVEAAMFHLNRIARQANQLEAPTTIRNTALRQLAVKGRRGEEFCRIVLPG